MNAPQTNTSIAPRDRLRSVAKRILSWHLPVTGPAKPLFATCYQIHVAAREGIAFALRFFWYEPLFRSQCHHIGSGFEMEQLPYLQGKGEIHLGKRVRFSGRPSFAFSRHFAERPTLHFGSDTFVGHNVAITVGRSVQIGSRCLLAGNVRISDFDGHSVDAHLRSQGGSASVGRSTPIVISDDVWIGQGALILKGCRIGARSVVAARAVVTGDVPEDVIVAGNPARIVRSLPSRPTHQVEPDAA